MSANKATKLWIQKTLNDLAVQRAEEAIFQTGKALPCIVTAVSGSVVTVGFQLDTTPWTLSPITIPKQESNWIRNPTQVGDTGITIPADTHICNVSGLGNALPKLTVKPGNMSALVFLPISNNNSPPTDPNAAEMKGPNGFRLETTAGTTCSIIGNTEGITATYGTSSLVINSTGITMNFAGKTVTFNDSGATIDGLLFETHQHTGVSIGSANTGGPIL